MAFGKRERGGDWAAADVFAVAALARTNPAGGASRDSPLSCVRRLVPPPTPAKTCTARQPESSVTIASAGITWSVYFPACTRGECPDRKREHLSTTAIGRTRDRSALVDNPAASAATPRRSIARRVRCYRTFAGTSDNRGSASRPETAARRGVRMAAAARMLAIASTSTRPDSALCARAPVRR